MTESIHANNNGETPPVMERPMPVLILPVTAEDARLLVNLVAAHVNTLVQMQKEAGKHNILMAATLRDKEAEARKFYDRIVASINDVVKRNEEAVASAQAKLAEIDEAKAQQDAEVDKEMQAYDRDSKSNREG